MPIKFPDISIFLILTSVFAIFFIGLAGIVYAFIFSLGYVLFRYFAWMIWKKIEINIQDKKLTITNMVFNQRKRSEILTEKFDSSYLILKEFKQSGMKRAMLQYQSHKLTDLVLLTHQEDIELVKNELFNKKSGTQN